MDKKQLTYDSRTDRYHGMQSDGTAIQIDADAFVDARLDRQDGGSAYDEAFAETADPDGWSEDMTGWIPADEHL